MNEIEVQLRDAADLAERAAVQGQFAELHGPRYAPAVIGGLELAADTLRHAATVISPPPVASRRTITEAVVMSSVWVISCAALLSTAPNPAQPLVLALAVAGSGVLSKLVSDVTVAIRDRREARRLADARTEPADVRHTVAELRTRISVITEALEPDRDDGHLRIGRSIESALVWLDGADYALTQTPER